MLFNSILFSNIVEKTAEAPPHTSTVQYSMRQKKSAGQKKSPIFIISFLDCSKQLFFIKFSTEFCIYIQNLYLKRKNLKLKKKCCSLICLKSALKFLKFVFDQMLFKIFEKNLTLKILN
jgi:hypothetical protein